MSAVLETLSHMPEAAVKRHRLSVEEVLELERSGFFRGKPRMELIEGELVEMAPIGPPHASMMDRLTRRLTRELPDSIGVRIQSSIRLGEQALPEPDVTLYRASADGFRHAHPGPGDIFAVIEVADSSLAYDRITKALLYARAGIPLYWLIDLDAQRVLEFRDPHPEGYQEQRQLRDSDALVLAAAPGWSLAVTEIFPAGA